MSPSPLDGYTVVTLARELPGPYATLVLSDLGADVINIERPTIGDPARHWPTFHEALNRGKRSVALDLHSSAGRAAFLRICGKADVVVEGFKPGTVDRLGVGYDDVTRVRSDIVYVSISAFGQSGPLSHRAAHGFSCEALAGRQAHRARAETLGTDESGTPPDLVADLAAASFAVTGITSALLRRATTGIGCYLDVSMADALMSWLTIYLMPALNGIEPDMPPRDPGRGLYATRDGRVLNVSIAREDHHWARLCDAIGLPQLRNLTARERVASETEIRTKLRHAFVARTLDEWDSILADLQLPYAPVLTMEEVACSAHFRERGLAVQVPANGEQPARWHVRQPLIFDQIDGYGPNRHAPALGAHTTEVLAWADAKTEAS